MKVGKAEAETDATPVDQGIVTMGWGCRRQSQTVQIILSWIYSLREYSMKAT